MKKQFLTVITALALSGFAAAQDYPDRSGWILGSGVGFGNLTEGLTLGAIPQLSFDNARGPWDLFFKLEYSFSFMEYTWYGMNQPRRPENGGRQGISFEIKPAYHVNLGPRTRLTFTADNQNYITIAPDPGRGVNRFNGLVDPGITLTRDAWAGEVYGIAGFPFSYGGPFYGDASEPDAYLALGLKFFSGDNLDDVSLEARGNFSFVSEKAYHRTDLRLIYKPVYRPPPSIRYARLEFTADRDLKAWTFTPALEFYVVEHFSIRIEACIGPYKNFSPTVWLKYHFKNPA